MACLILQLKARKSVPRLVVEEHGQGLRVSLPVGPVQHMGDEGARSPEQRHEKAVHLTRDRRRKARDIQGDPNADTGCSSSVRRG